MPKIFQPNSYGGPNVNGVAANNLVITSQDFVKKTTGVIAKAAAGDTIVGLSDTQKTFASDNQTVAMAEVEYSDYMTTTRYILPVAGETITFSGALVTSNVINLKVNGTAMTPVTYATSDANTLGLIASQLVSQFPTLIASASAGTNSVKVTPVVNNGSVTITNIVVTLGAGQATGTVANNILAYTDEGKFYDITTGGQALDYHTAHASSGQLLLRRITPDGTMAICTIANT